MFQIIPVIPRDNVQIIGHLLNLCDGRVESLVGHALDHELIVVGHPVRGPGLDVQQVDAVPLEHLQVSGEHSDLLCRRAEDDAGALGRVPASADVVAARHQLRLEIFELGKCSGLSKN